jgi:hypothetical protein
VLHLAQYEMQYKEWRLKAERLESDVGILQVRLVTWAFSPFEGWPGPSLLIMCALGMASDGARGW